MRKGILFLVWSCFTALMFVGCSSGSDEMPTPPSVEPPVVEKIPIVLNCGISSAIRATDTGFETNDKIGLYVVNHQNGASGVLQSTGNHADNVSFSYDGKWNPSTPIYWKDNTTPADFYLYYPYNASVADVTAYTFAVKTDQSSLAAYKASDFLYGKKKAVTPTEQAVNITADHLMSCVLVKVAAGNGFTPESLAAAKVSVSLNGQLPTAQINLREGTIQASGTPSAILPYKEGDNYKALVVPQSVTADNFITVNVNGRNYNLKKSFTFEKGKRYTFTVTVSKTSNGVNVEINPWGDDGVDHGGTAE